MKKIWLDHYQAGVPEEIDPDSFATLVDLFEDSCEKYKDKAAFINFCTTITYGELHRLTTDVAAYLQQELGLKKGARIAIMLPNTLQFPVMMFAALRAGLIVVNVNPLYTAEELTHQLNDAQCEAILVLSNFAHTVEAALPRTQLKHIIVTEMGDLLGGIKGHLVNFVVKYVKRLVPRYSLTHAIPFKQVLAKGQQQHFKAVDIASKDIAFLQYTGGTTGVAKGAELTHRNLIANVEQLSAWIHPVVREGRETVVTALPLYHIFALNANGLLFFKYGATNLLITNPRDMKNFIKDLRRHPFTVLIGVNTLFNSLLNAKGFADLDFSHLHLSLGGGMAVHESVANEWKEVTGGALIEGYGLTETSPVISANPMDISAYTGSIGLPLPSTDISIRDQQGNEVALGEVGELCARGPQVMLAYWNQEAETKKVLTEDGWLRTGDLVVMDEKGYMRIVDRIKDMILVSGFNVYPNEVEEVIAEHPAHILFVARFWF